MYFYQVRWLTPSWKLQYDAFNLSPDHVIKGHVTCSLGAISSFPPNLIHIYSWYFDIETWHYKVRQLLQNERENNCYKEVIVIKVPWLLQSYYKVWQKFIRKYVRYYKVWQTVITKCVSRPSGVASRLPPPPHTKIFFWKMCLLNAPFLKEICNQKCTWKSIDYSSKLK